MKLYLRVDGEVTRELDVLPVSAGAAARQLASVRAVLGYWQEEIKRRGLDLPAPEDASFEEVTDRILAVGEVNDIRDGAYGLMLAMFLGRDLPELESQWRQGLAVWEKLVSEGWSSAELFELYEYVSTSRQALAFNAVGRAASVHWSTMGGDNESAMQRALWALSVRHWGSTDAWQEQDEEEVGRLLILEMANYRTGGVRGD